jgi:hypothetical protein
MSTDHTTAAQAVVEGFPQRGTDRLFLNCWIPEAQLVAAVAACIARHGDVGRWWDGLHDHLDPQAPPI